MVCFVAEGSLSSCIIGRILHATFVHSLSPDDVTYKKECATSGLDRLENKIYFCKMKV